MFRQTRDAFRRSAAKRNDESRDGELSWKVKYPTTVVVTPSKLSVWLNVRNPNWFYSQKLIVWCTVVLPCGERLAAALSTGTVSILSLKTGAIQHTLRAHKPRTIGERALVVLGNDTIASGGRDGKLVTWDTVRGKLVAEAATKSGIDVLAALSDQRLVSGRLNGAIVLYSHRNGRDLTEDARIPNAHNGRITDFAVCGTRLATASDDCTVGVWDTASLKRLAVLCGHAKEVCSVDMNRSFIVTSSLDRTVRMFSANADGYSCKGVFRFGFDHVCFMNVRSPSRIFIVTILDGNHLMLGTSHSVEIVHLSFATRTAEAKSFLTSHVILSATVLPRGLLALSGVQVGEYSGHDPVMIMDPRSEIRQLLRSHLAASSAGHGYQRYIASVARGQILAVEAWENLMEENASGTRNKANSNLRSVASARRVQTASADVSLHLKKKCTLLQSVSGKTDVKGVLLFVALARAYKVKGNLDLQKSLDRYLSLSRWTHHASVRLQDPATL